MDHHHPLLPWAGLGLCVLALLACKKDDEKTSATAEPTSLPAPPATTPPSLATTPPAPPAAATAAPTAPTDPAVVVPVRPQFRVGDVPEIPAGKSNPPQGTEWDQGVPVNTQGVNARAKRCSMHVLREWLRIYCAGDVIGYEKKEDFGELYQDYYEKIVPGKYASFVIRLRPGKSQKIRICREKDRASLFVNWPGSKDRPVHVALGHGPICDGSDWGVGYGKKKGASAVRLQPGSVEMTGDESQAAASLELMAQQSCRNGDPDACLFLCGKTSCP